MPMFQYGKDLRFNGSVSARRQPCTNLLWELFHGGNGQHRAAEERLERLLAKQRSAELACRADETPLQWSLDA
jgi:hypothetical protein